MRSLRCFLGRHDIPDNGITQYYGAVWRGGYCSRCERVIRGKFLFNAWDDNKTKKVGKSFQLTGTNPKLSEGLESGKYLWA